MLEETKTPRSVVLGVFYAYDFYFTAGGATANLLYLIYFKIAT